MKNIIDTETFLGAGAVYTIDLLKEENGKLLVDIHQSGEGVQYNIEQIPMSDLSKLIGKLQHFYAIMNVVKPSTSVHVDQSKSEKIVDYYFKNVKIKDISKMLNVSGEMVKHELTIRGIDIIPLEPKTKWWNKRKK